LSVVVVASAEIISNQNSTEQPAHLYATNRGREGCKGEREGREKIDIRRLFVPKRGGVDG